MKLYLCFFCKKNIPCNNYILALSEDGKSVMDTFLYKKALEKAALCKIPMLAHCEDKSLVHHLLRAVHDQ